MPGPTVPHQKDDRLQVDRPPAKGGGVLTWLAAIVGLGVIAGLVFVGTQIVGSMTSRNALERAEQNPPAQGTYAVDAPAAQAGDDLSVALDDVVVRTETVDVALTWTNTGDEDVVWDCGTFSSPSLTWYAESIELGSYATTETGTPCDPEQPTVAPGETQSEVHTFAKDGSWGAGPVRIFSQAPQDGIPGVEFEVALPQD